MSDNDSIRFQCHNCNKSVKVRSSSAGKEISCSKCNTALLIPPTPAATRMTSPDRPAIGPLKIKIPVEPAEDEVHDIDDSDHEYAEEVDDEDAISHVRNRESIRGSRVQKRFLYLRLLANIYRVFGSIAIIIGITAAVAVVVALLSQGISGTMPFAILFLACLFTAGQCWFMSECIFLFVAIEHNTRKTASLMEQNCSE